MIYISFNFLILFVIFFLFMKVSILVLQQKPEILIGLKQK